MSGGYFNYEDNRLLDFAQKIENEIICNDNDEETFIARASEIYELNENSL